jgi:hypothetical protein
MLFFDHIVPLFDLFRRDSSNKIRPNPCRCTNRIPARPIQDLRKGHTPPSILLPHAHPNASPPPAKGHAQGPANHLVQLPAPGDPLKIPHQLPPVTPILANPQHPADGQTGPMLVGDDQSEDLAEAVRERGEGVAVEGGRVEVPEGLVLGWRLGRVLVAG